MKVDRNITEDDIIGACRGEKKIEEESNKCNRSTQIFSCLLTPIVANAILVWILYLDIQVPIILSYILAVVYLLMLIPFYGIHILRDLKIKEWYKNQFFQTPELPNDPPKLNGYMYLKKIDNEKYESFYRDCIIKVGENIIETDRDYLRMIFTMGNKEFHIDHLYDEHSVYRSRNELLSEIEECGYKVMAIKSIYNEYLWIRGKTKDKRKRNQKFSKIKLPFISVILTISCLTPIVGLIGFNGIIFIIFMLIGTYNV